MTIRPEEVHPSHDVREEGWTISDPCCQVCRASVYDSPERLKQICSPQKAVRPTAIESLIAERKRHAEEGWTPEHDDEHENGELAAAAACYAYGELIESTACGYIWPWDIDWWKPSDRRRELVKAGSLLIAEIERLDRKEARND